MGTKRLTMLALSVSVCGAALLSNEAMAQASQANEMVFERERPLYDAKGLPAGAFRILPTLDVAEEYNDNIFSSDGNEESDFITHVEPGIRVESDWSRHSLSAFANVKSSIYSENSAEDHTDYGVGADARLDVLRETYLSLGGSHRLLHEDRGDPNAGTSITEPTEYEQNNANFSLFRGLRRFSVKVDGDYTEKDYEDDAQLGGGVNNNDDRDRYKALGAVRLGYEILPDYEAFIRGELNQVEYDTAADDNGFDRDSEGYEAQVGLALDLGGKTRGEVSVGYMEQDYDDPSLETVDDFTFDVALTWNPTQITSLRLSADRGIEETVLSGASAYVNTGGRVELQHELTRQVLLGAGISYYDQEYEGQGINRNDEYYGANAKVTYLINRYLETDLSYVYQERDSDNTGLDFKQNRVLASLGMKF